MIPLPSLRAMTLERASEELAMHHPFKLNKTTLLLRQWEELVNDAWIENLGAHALSVYMRTDPDGELYMLHPTEKPHTDKMHLVVVHVQDYSEPMQGPESGALPRTVTLEQRGWHVEGEATGISYYGTERTIQMRPTFIPLGCMTKTALIRTINDNGHGFEAITSAMLSVCEVYGQSHKTNWRTILIHDPPHHLVQRGI